MTGTTTDRREQILSRLAALLATIGPPVERNRTLEIPEADLPRIVLRDGDEEISPPGNAPPELMLDRWRMTPEIEYYLDLRSGKSVGAAQGETLAAIKSDKALLAMLARDEGISAARIEPFYAETRASIAGFRFTITLTYHKE